MTFLLLRVVRAILVSRVFPRVETFFSVWKRFFLVWKYFFPVWKRYFPRVEMGGGVWLVRLVAGWNG